MVGLQDCWITLDEWHGGIFYFDFILFYLFSLCLKLGHHLFQLFGRLLRYLFPPAVFCGLKEFTRLAVSMRVTR